MSIFPSIRPSQKTKLCFLAALLSATAALPSAASEPFPLEVDLADARLFAEVRATGHSFQASVSTFEAAIAWDPQAGSIAAAELSFDLAALTTGHPRRDREMLRWLDAETHPRARFRLIELEQIDDGLLAHGRFLLHGREQPLTLRLALSGQADTLGVEGTATLDHRDWDLPRIRTLLVMTVDPVLKVHFSLQASLPEGHTIANRE